MELYFAAFTGITLKSRPKCGWCPKNYFFAMKFSYMKKGRCGTVFRCFYWYHLKILHKMWVMPRKIQNNLFAMKLSYTMWNCILLLLPVSPKDLAWTVWWPKKLHFLAMKLSYMKKGHCGTVFCCFYWYHLEISPEMWVWPEKSKIISLQWNCHTQCGTVFCCFYRYHLKILP